jgi:hypothetical protein
VASIEEHEVKLISSVLEEYVQQKLRPLAGTLDIELKVCSSKYR